MRITSQSLEYVAHLGGRKGCYRTGLAVDSVFVHLCS